MTPVAVSRDAAIYGALVDKKLIGRDQLEALLLECAKSGHDPEQVLLSRHEVSKRAIGDALSSFYKCPFVEHDAKFVLSKELVGAISVQYLRTRLWVPLWMEGGTIHVAIHDPHSADTLQDIHQIYPGNQFRFYVSLRRDIQLFIDSISAPEAPAPEPSIASLLATIEPAAVEEETPVHESDGAIVRLANQIILDACKAGASDIHLEPYHDKDMVIRFRVDGDCSIYQKIPLRYRRALVSRIKIMAGLDISEHRRPQDGKIGFKTPEKLVELRVATIPTAGNNEDIVLRILASGDPVPLDRLELSQANLRDLQRTLQLPYGLFLCVGPTGSGKTTTLHSALWYLNGPDIKIWTAEDPVEITQYGLRQVQVQPKIGFTFAAAMRAFLRADPDVIMVGEMRDKETAEIAIEASLTGHLVLSTLHTNSAVETVARLLDFGIDPFNYSDALLGILAQRLVRRICPKCSRPIHPPRSTYDELARHFGEEEFERLGVRYDADFRLAEGQGCESCHYTGYQGRLGVHELLIAADEIKKLIQARAPAAELFKRAQAYGMKTLVQDGILKCLQGFTDFTQVKAVAIK